MARQPKKAYDREYLVSQVAMMRIKGSSTHTILDFLMVELEMSRKVAYAILLDAQNYIMDQTNNDIDVAFTEAINRLENIYEHSDNKLKLETQKEINKLRGLYAAQKVDITSNGKEITEIKLIQINKKDDIE